MISMKDLSRSSSAAYEPLARSTSPYRDDEELEAPLRSRSPSPTPTGQRKVVLSNRRRWVLVLALLVLLLMGMYWRAGLGGDGLAVSRKDEEVALGLEGEVEDGGVGNPVQEDEWRAEELATPSPTQASATEPPSELEETLEDSSDDSVDAEVIEDDVSESTETDVPSSTDEDEPLEESDPELDSTELEVTPVIEAPTIPILNVRPHPRPPPSDPIVASQMRYLSYENHSGFHNQRKSFVNALLVAHMLNRTLLLPPARLGSTAPWEPTLESIIPFEERCKQGNPLLTDGLCATTAHSDGDRWTYVALDYLMDAKLLEGRKLVDRWNGSMEWIFENVEKGGLGLEEEDVVRFADAERRSYQFYDDRTAPTRLDQFARRIDLEDLQEGARGDARLLHFGSMFGGGRIKLAREENLREQQKLGDTMVFDIEKVDGISDEIRDALGSYVGVHLRVGDGVFKTKAQKNMQGVFRKLCKDVFKLKQTQITALLDDSASRPAPRAFPSRHGRRSSHTLTGSAWALTDDVQDPSDLDSSLDFRRRPRRSLPLKRDAPRPLSPHLRCRSALHTVPHLIPLNMPLYIATDSRHPLTDRNLAHFFHHFPCTFLLNDFSGAESAVNDKPIADLVEMVEGKWKSDWDGHGLSNYLYPFLEAEVAAKGIAVVGTPQSTFSGYTAGTLHQAYRQQNKTTEQIPASVSIAPSSIGEDAEEEMEEEDAGKSAMELEAEALEAQMREEARLGQA